MRKWPLLIPNAIAATCLPFICLSSCGKEEKEILPDQIEIWYGDHQTGPIELDVNSTLEFFATTFPEEATKNLVFNSSNESLAKFEGNKLIPQGYGPHISNLTNITAYPVGHPEYISKSTTIAVTITKDENFDSVDESKTEIVEPIISSSSINTYGITLSNFKVDWTIDDGHFWESYYLTAQIEWISVESMKDYAAGVINIDYDSFYNSYFDIICSFETTNTIEIGHVFKFKLNFKIPQLGKEISGSKIYSVVYEGDDNLVIDDSSVTKKVDFNYGDGRHTTITGFKTNFDFGDETLYKLKINSYDLFDDTEDMDPIYEIVNKRKDGDGWAFDLSISLQFRPDDFEERKVHFYFILNNVAIYSTDDYLFEPMNVVQWETGHLTSCFAIETEDNLPKLKLNDFETNFDLLTNPSSLTVKFWTDDEELMPISYNIIKKTDRTFDLEFIWKEDLVHFDVKPFKIDFYLGTDISISFFYSNFKFATDNITFVGDASSKLGFNTSHDKYFIRLTYFQANFDLDKNLISIENLNFIPEIVEPEVEIENFSSSYDTFDLYLYWNTEFECPDSVNGTFDMLYDGQTMIDNFNFTFTKPSETSYYDVTTETNYGDIDVITNKKDEEIKVGIKNIDTIARELIGFYVKVNNIFYTYDYGRYEYVQQSEDEYKMMIYVNPNSELAYEPIGSTDKVTIGAIFGDKNSVINLTESKQTTMLDRDMESFQTKQTINLIAGRTYYIKADLALWDASEEWTSTTQCPLGFFFVCGENIDDSSTFKELNQPLYCFYQQFGVDQIDYSPSGVKTIGIETDEFLDIQPLITSKIVFAWTPTENISNVHFALNSIGQYH